MKFKELFEGKNLIHCYQYFLGVSLAVIFINIISTIFIILKNYQGVNILNNIYNTFIILAGFLFSITAIASIVGIPWIINLIYDVKYKLKRKFLPEEKGSIFFIVMTTINFIGYCFVIYLVLKYKG